ncbi:hypothetical protein ACN20G_23645 [Streptomyces sp. BI20]|uniref:hypothetical protein n=1 Tax=Streptomyces sp. BI20 TaxID=3403460 RepID=UPI003C74F938
MIGALVALPVLFPIPVSGCDRCDAALKLEEQAKRTGSRLSLRAAREVYGQHPHRATTDLFVGVVLDDEDDDEEL